MRSTEPARVIFRYSDRMRLTLLFILLGLLALLLADLKVTTSDPWSEVDRMLAGFAQPGVESVAIVFDALLATLAFALLGVLLGATAGFLLALCYSWRPVRLFCAVIRSIHELFWALIFLQFFGLHPLSGLLAIAIPYSGIFARIYRELIDQAPPGAEQALSPDAGYISGIIYARVMTVWPHLVSYTSYRLECGIRSSAILGFVGLPTLGYYLESSFSQGFYSEVAALLLLFYLLIITKNIWLRRWTLPLLLLASPLFLGEGLPLSWGNLWRFISVDIIPSPLLVEQTGVLDTLSRLSLWLQDIVLNQAIPGLWNTLVLSQLALLCAGVLALLWMPLVSRHFVSRPMAVPGQLWLVIARSTPEYLLAYIALQLFGPSMLPAVLALAIHNGGLVAYLTGQQTNQLNLRPDCARRLSDRYCYEVLPRSYSGFLSFMLYRWEVIMRETAILGVLGIHSIGFFIDSAIQEIRLDVAVILIILTALLNIIVDSLSRRLQQTLKSG